VKKGGKRVGAGNPAGYELVDASINKDIDVEQLAKRVLLDLIREKVEENPIEEFIDWSHHRVIIKIPLDYFADALRYEYKRITQR